MEMGYQGHLQKEFDEIFDLILVSKRKELELC
jgi:hypothetical protein